MWQISKQHWESRVRNVLYFHGSCSLIFYSFLSQIFYASSFVWCLCSLSCFFLKRFIWGFIVTSFLLFLYSVIHYIIPPFIVFFTITSFLFPTYFFRCFPHSIFEYIGRAYFNISISCFYRKHLILTVFWQNLFFSDRWMLKLPAYAIIRLQVRTHRKKDLWRKSMGEKRLSGLASFYSISINTECLKTMFSVLYTKCNKLFFFASPSHHAYSRTPVAFAVFFAYNSHLGKWII